MKVLLCAPGTVVSRLKPLFYSVGAEVETPPNGELNSILSHKDCGDAISLAFVGGAQNEVELYCRQISQYDSIPIIMINGQETDWADPVCQQACGHLFMAEESMIILARLQAILRRLGGVN